MQTLLIFLLISVVAILNINGKPFPSNDLSENSRPTNAMKQVLTPYVVDFLSNNESLRNRSYQNVTANNVEIMMGKDVIERESLHDKDLQPTDNESEKRNKRSPTLTLRKNIRRRPMQLCGLMKNMIKKKITSNRQRRNTTPEPHGPYVKNIGGSHNVHTYIINSNNVNNSQVYKEDKTLMGNNKYEDEYSDQSSTGMEDNEYGYGYPDD